MMKPGNALLLIRDAIPNGEQEELIDFIDE